MLLTLSVEKYYIALTEIQLKILYVVFMDPLAKKVPTPALNPYTVFLNPNLLSLCTSYLSCGHINQWCSTTGKFIAPARAPYM